MNQVLETISRPDPYRHPLLRVQYGNCSRKYVTTSPAWNVSRMERCIACRRGDGWDAKAAEQRVCAGFDGACQRNAEAPASAFRKSVIATRRGRPWRCACCATRRARSLPKERAA